MASASSVSRNAIYIREQATSLIGSSSVVIKGICLSLILFYFLSFSEYAFTHLSAIPGYILPPNLWIWTLVTHSFLQVHFWLLIIDVIVVILAGKLLEPLWGAMEMAIFYVMVNALSAVITTLVYMVAYFVVGNPAYLFETYIHGLPAYIGGFCVAVKQIMPDQVLFVWPYGKFRNSHIPLTFLLGSVCLRFLKVVSGPYPIMVLVGILISWTYLRFYQKHSSGNRGDLADSFSFASFFPSPLDTPIAMIANTLFGIMVKVKLCKKPQTRYDFSAPTGITVTLPGTDPQDAERRRQLAIKALNERLNKSADDSSWPALEEDDDNKEAGTATVHSGTSELSPPQSEPKVPDQPESS